MDNLEMDQELAKKLLVEGGTLVFLDVPPGTEFGIDLKTWDTGNKFKGVKMIPPGPHVIYYSPRNKYGDVAPRVSFFHTFNKGEMLVKKWDAKEEGLSEEAIPDSEVDRLKSNLLQLDKYLGPYPYDTYDTWKKLSGHITDQLITRLSPECGVIRSALDLVSSPDSKPVGKRNGRTKTDEQREEEKLPQLVPIAGTNLRFTPIPERGYPEGSSAQDITKHSLDQSFTVESMISSVGDPNELVAELQFSFICFLMGQSLESLESWRTLVQVLCKCRSAVIRRRQMYFNFIQALEVQLDQIPGDFLVDIVSSNNAIYSSLRELFLTMSESSDIEGRLKCEAERMKERLTKKFCWDFEDLDLEVGDDAPVVVSLEAVVDQGFGTQVGCLPCATLIISSSSSTSSSLNKPAEKPHVDQFTRFVHTKRTFQSP